MTRRDGGARWVDRHPRLLQLGILLGYLVLGILVTWPRATYLRGLLPIHRDQSLGAWDLWWVARQVTHLRSPFTTQYMIAPVGAPLAWHVLMPLVGVVMMPVTLTAGATVSLNVLAVLMPGLAAYAMYRAARLWLGQAGSLAAGALFGFSSMLDYRAWFQIQIAVGAVFLPATLEAVVRLRRATTWWRGAVVGLVLGLCMLTDLQSAFLALMVAGVVLVPWLVRRPSWLKLGTVCVAAAVGLLVAAPQVIAMLQQGTSTATSSVELAHDYTAYNVALPQLFSPSPRVGTFGLAGLGHLFYDGIQTEGIPTFGVMLSALALCGLALGWRIRRAWLWFALWLGAALLALGPVLDIVGRTYVPLPTQFGGLSLSRLMPYTWLIHVPGLSAFKEANRFTVLGLLPATLLAGSTVDWVRRRWALGLVPLVVLAALELGWSTTAPEGNMPTSFPAVDRAIAADRSSSIVVDVPYGLRGGGNRLGPPWPAQALLNAIADGHPRAIANVSRTPLSTLVAVCRHPFYADMLDAQAFQPPPSRTIRFARADARQMHVGWVIVWTSNPPTLRRFLAQTGFVFRYRAGGALVYRARAGGPTTIRDQARVPAWVLLGKKPPHVGDNNRC